MPSGRNPPRDFGRYAAIEAVNVFLIPAAAIFLAPPRDSVDAAALTAAILPTSALLVLGAVYWEALNRRLKGDRRLHQRWLPLADRAQWPLLALTIFAVVASTAALVLRGFTGPVVAAFALTLLAVLEYINYYHLQLQHFDKWADFRKLIATGKLRPAHSARDLAAYRKLMRLPASTSAGVRGRT